MTNENKQTEKYLKKLVEEVIENNKDRAETQTAIKELLLRQGYHEDTIKELKLTQNSLIDGLTKRLDLLNAKLIQMEIAQAKTAWLPVLATALLTGFLVTVGTTIVSKSIGT